MELKLEQLEYQRQAIQSVISVFKGQTKNTFDNACMGGIRSNILSLSPEELIKNIRNIVIGNGIKEETANLHGGTNAERYFQTVHYRFPGEGPFPRHRPGC